MPICGVRLQPKDLLISFQYITELPTLHPAANGIALEEEETTGTNGSAPHVNMRCMTPTNRTSSSHHTHDICILISGKVPAEVRRHAQEDLNNVSGWAKRNKITINDKKTKVMRFGNREHPSMDINDIKAELEKLGHNVQDIINIRQRATKVPLPMYYVNVLRKENNGKIYKINRMLNCVVEFQAPRTKREIPQCTNCQRFGHTFTYCRRGARCVKCPEEHSTEDCPRKVKCTNCGGAHPANYRGCEAHKKLQQQYFPKLREKILSRTAGGDNSNKNNATQHQSTPVVSGVSYASIVRGNTNTHTQGDNPASNTSSVQPSSDMAELMEMMKGLMQQMSTVLNLLTLVVRKQN